MAWFWKSHDREIERYGLDPALFKQAGEYKLLLKNLKKLSAEEHACSQDFVKRSLEDELDYDAEINRLADSQTVIVLYAIDAVSEQQCTLGPDMRAHIIINNIGNLKNMFDALKNQGNPNEVMEELRETLKTIYKEACSKCKNKYDANYDDLKALLGDVQFKFKVPQIRITES